MVFSSLEFLLMFLTVTLLVYFIVPLKARNIVLLIVSLIFYGWGEPVYVFLMIFTIAVDYIFGLLVERNLQKDDRKRAKTCLVLSIVINLSILGFFKYYDFFVSNLRLIPGLSGLPLLGLSLPIGISFYTFQALSYVIDVYRGDTGAQHNAAAFGAYVTLYPQLIAGPIVRYKDVDDQLTEREHSVPLFADGVRTFVAGMGKKVLLANMAGQLWEYFKATPTDERTVVGAWLGMLCYTFQIYFDFSGYSDMAIGLGKMIGFRFLENFNYPYISKSASEFWHRWHISLGSFFRDYVYIPLGGNRRGRARTALNLAIVWALTGLWHGASWNFVIWGLYYGVLIILEKLVLADFREKLPGAAQHIAALFLIVVGWTVFYYTDMGCLGKHLGAMFGIGAAGLSDPVTMAVIRKYTVLPLIAAIASLPILPQLKAWLGKHEKLEGAADIVSLVCLTALMLLSMIFIVGQSYNPFIYFRF